MRYGPLSPPPPPDKYRGSAWQQAATVFSNVFLTSPDVAADWLALLLRNVRPETDYIRQIFYRFPSGRCHDRFLPYPFQIHNSQSSSYYITYKTCSWELVVKVKHKTPRAKHWEYWEVWFEPTTSKCAHPPLHTVQKTSRPFQCICLAPIVLCKQDSGYSCEGGPSGGLVYSPCTRLPLPK
jgi:hypothetical protein